MFSEEQKTSKASNNYYLRAGHHAGMTSVDKTGKKITAKKQVGQHPGTIESKQFEKSERGWVNITGIVGQHETERWVSMLRNLHLYGFELFVRCQRETYDDKGMFEYHYKNILFAESKESGIKYL